MKKLYSLKGCLSVIVVCLFSTVSFSQPICGPIVEDFNTTSGSTAGFTGDFLFGSNGSNGYLQKDRVVSTAVYGVNTPTYQLANNASYIGYGFLLSGSERVARVEAKITYISTLNGEMLTVFLGQFIPSYNPNPNVADVCRAISLSDLPGFPIGGRYRFRFEFSPITGRGNFGESITFDDFRTNGTLSQASLPVSFVGFDAKRSGSSVLLTWKIAGEENVNRYEVERSTDGRIFTKLAAITRHGKDTYTYSDMSAPATVYYRIKNVDNDGKFKYSAIARLSGNKNTLVLKAFPMPAQNYLTLHHPSVDGNALVSVSTVDGRIAQSIQPAIGSMQTTLDMSQLRKGIYLLRFSNENGETQTLKVIKQ